jgi:hypothetical protein
VLPYFDCLFSFRHNQYEEYGETFDTKKGRKKGGGQSRICAMQQPRVEHKAQNTTPHTIATLRATLEASQQIEDIVLRG